MVYYQFQDRAGDPDRLAVDEIIHLAQEAGFLKQNTLELKRNCTINLFRK